MSYRRSDVLDHGTNGDGGCIDKDGARGPLSCQECTQVSGVVIDYAAKELALQQDGPVPPSVTGVLSGSVAVTQRFWELHRG